MSCSADKLKSSELILTRAAYVNTYCVLQSWLGCEAGLFSCEQPPAHHLAEWGEAGRGRVLAVLCGSSRQCCVQGKAGVVSTSFRIQPGIAAPSSWGPSLGAVLQLRPAKFLPRAQEACLYQLKTLPATLRATCSCHAAGLHVGHEVAVVQQSGCSAGVLVNARRCL